ncbi:hypothetical protein MMC17_005650 [Xylographa soralifera]|nr:hypothetical protein [Xylographa soralifera]
MLLKLPCLPAHVTTLEILVRALLKPRLEDIDTVHKVFRTSSENLSKLAEEKYQLNESNAASFGTKEQELQDVQKRLDETAQHFADSSSINKYMGQAREEAMPLSNEHQQMSIQS